MSESWQLVCSACGTTADPQRLASVCEQCGQPLLVLHDDFPAPRQSLRKRWDMWRYAAFLPLREDEAPVSLGEGCTPLIELPLLAAELGIARLLVKDEALNPTASFKARGMSAAVTRARALGVQGLVVPTAGNAGAALAAYARAAGVPARVYAPRATPRVLLDTITALGAELVLVEGHIGDAGRAAREWTALSGWFDVSTLREPFRIEGKKTLGIELAEQLGWMLPDVIVYPTGGGTGLIGMWKAFHELRRSAWIGSEGLPRMITAQAAGCAPIVRAFGNRAAQATPWNDPRTHASGLRVPAPLGDRLILKALRESGGDAHSAREEEIRAWTARLAQASGIDVAPEGGCAMAVCSALVAQGRLDPAATVVVFNTGSGASYRQ